MYWCPTHILLCFCLFFFVLCLLCGQFLWMIYFWLPIRYSLSFIYLPDSLAFPFLMALLVSSIHYQRDLLSATFFDDEYILNTIHFVFQQQSVTQIYRLSSASIVFMTFEVCPSNASFSLGWLYYRQLLLLNGFFSNLSYSLISKSNLVQYIYNCISGV